MIVDDHLANIEAIKILLQCTLKLDPDTLCDSAINGQEAIQIIKRDVLEVHNGSNCSYALILIDV